MATAVIVIAATAGRALIDVIMAVTEIAGVAVGCDCCDGYDHCAVIAVVVVC